MGEKVLSGAGDPRFGDEAAALERDSCVVEEVDDVIQQFFREVYVGWTSPAVERHITWTLEMHPFKLRVSHSVSDDRVAAAVVVLLQLP